ncbi:MAG: molybdenum metabolism regulator, partial [Proteobacteria bacterium]|nr:molybdenum metabolism regulator [Pseudomonadota bacterium]
VTHLALANAEATDELCTMRPGSAILPRLRSLDLSRGTMSATGLAALLAHAPAFAHLERLDLSQNFLVGDLAAVTTLAAVVECGDQREPFDDGTRYVAIGE